MLTLYTVILTAVACHAGDVVVDGRPLSSENTWGCRGNQDGGTCASDAGARARFQRVASARDARQLARGDVVGSRARGDVRVGASDASVSAWDVVGVAVGHQTARVVGVRAECAGRVQVGVGRAPVPPQHRSYLRVTYENVLASITRDN